MAGLTKEERAKRQAEKEKQIRDEIRQEVLSELEKKNAKSNKATTKAKKKPEIIKIPLDTLVPVTCNTEGGATYIPRGNPGDIITWAEIGVTEYMELSELVKMRNTDRRFFVDNWIILEDTDDYTADDLYKFLKVDKFYQNVMTPDDIEALFEMDANEIKSVIDGLSVGMRETIAIKAKVMYDNNTLNLNIVRALEQALGVKFDLD